MSYQWEPEQMRDFVQSVSILKPKPIGCTCGQEFKALPWEHGLGCEFRIEAAKQMRAIHSANEKHE